MTMTDPQLEDLVTGTLRAKAAQVVTQPGAFDPAAAPLGGPARPRRRPPLLAAAAVLVLVVAAAIGLAIALTGDDTEDLRPAGRPVPVQSITFVALGALKYDPAEVTVAPGPTEIRLASEGGTHTLVFDDPTFADFRLSVPRGDDRETVELEAGRDYTVFCAIPGHRQAGMEAVIHVVDPATATNGPTTTTVLATPTTLGGGP
jgi:plastocyanin